MAISPVSNVSPAFAIKLYEQRCSDADVLLITISHDSWGDDLRISTSNKDYLWTDESTNLPVGGFISRDKQYIYAGLNVQLPNSASEQAPEAVITFSNITQEISEKLKIVDAEYPEILMELVTWDEPDIVEAEFPDMRATTASWSGSEGQVTLIHDIASNEPCPCHTFNLIAWPGLKDA